jgi:ferredoxin/nitrate reductase gamma subunit
MSYRADPEFLTELKRYGDVQVESCFNCGNCTAVCPLSDDMETFPRRAIRYAQLGLTERLLSSRELWMCYNCGECSETCPREAEPGEFMAAARRYAIARYDRFGLARRLYTSATFNLLFLIAAAVVLGLFLYSFHGPMPGDTLALFEFIPSEVIHNVGMIAGLVIVALALLGVVTMARQVAGAADLPQAARLNWLGALWEALVVEGLAQKRYRRDCETYGDGKPRHLQKWFIHASMLWGFLGLFAATALDYLLELLGIKATGTWMPIWHPIRLLGTVAGLFLIYGATMSIIKRLRKDDESTAHSTPSDWSFLILLWLTGMTGFVVEMSLYLPHPASWNYWMLLVHLVVAFELLLLIPFTKFAHAMYRTVALYVHALKPLPEREAVGASAD